MITDNYQIVEGSPQVVASKCNNLMKYRWECIGPLYIMQQGDNIVAFQGMQKPNQQSSDPLSVSKKPNIGSISE